jgi:hypothetical protein
MVKKSEARIVSYCDFCAPESDFEKKPYEAEEAKRKMLSFQACTLCNKDLCDRHIYKVMLPAERTGYGWRAIDNSEFCYNRREGYVICPECANLQLAEIGILLLRKIASVKEGAVSLDK